MDLLMIILVILLPMAYIVVAYNRLITLRNRVKEAWSAIEVQMKRRYDLIPNLINTVKGYAQHEKSTLEQVVQARSQAMGNQGTAESQAKDENILSGTLKSLFALSESYPDLKANQNFMKLQEELTYTEDKINSARHLYNTNVLAMNNKVQHFPSNIIAGIFNFSKETFFELDAAEKEKASKPVNVEF